MIYVVISIGVIAIGVLLFLIFNAKKIRKSEKFQSSNMDLMKKETQFPEVVYEKMSLDMLTPNTKMVEVTDNKLLAQLNFMAPKLFEVSKGIKKAVEAKDLYCAILPAGKKLVQSKNMPGAVRGFYQNAGKMGGHADWLQVTNAKDVRLEMAVSSAMEVAAMVVGQYYMAEIDSKLETISQGVESIVEFLDNEYKSKVFALMVQVRRVSKFEVRILENDELRNEEISNLNNWEQQCIELLGQANQTIANMVSKSDLNYNDYEKKTEELQKWINYQKMLMQILTTVAELRYALHLGSVSMEQCAALLPTYTKQSGDALKTVKAWHENQIECTKINLEEKKRKEQHIFGFLIDDWNYKTVSEDMVSRIQEQSSEYQYENVLNKPDLFAQGVKVVVKDNKVYYLPEEKRM